MYERLLIARYLCAPGLCSAEGDEPGDEPGGGGAPPAKKTTFTQDDVTRIAAKEKKEGERAAREKADADWKEKWDAAQAELAEAKKASMTADERAKAEAKERDEAERKTREERENKLKEKLSTADQKAKAADERWKGDRRSGALATALHGAKVIGEAASDAADVMLGKSKIDVDDDGAITSVIYGGKSYDTLGDAAKQFLLDKPHFAQPTATGGAGTRGGTGGGQRGNGGKPLIELSRDQLMAMDREKRAGGRK